MATKSRSAKISLALVLALPPDPQAAAIRLDAVKRALIQARLKAEWILVVPFGSAEALGALPEVHTLKAKVLELGRTHQAWAGNLSAANATQAEHLLFLPEQGPLDPLLLADLASEAPNFDWLISRRGPSDAQVRFLAGLVRQPLLLDPASPCLVRRGALLNLADLHPPQRALLGQRLLRGAVRIGQTVGEMPYAAAQASLNLAQIMSSDADAWRRQTSRRLDWLLAAAATTAAGALLYNFQPVLGLTLLGVGAVATFSLLSQSE